MQKVTIDVREIQYRPPEDRMGEQSVTSVNPLEQFVLLAKNVKGAAAVELIKQALEAPNVFVFGELLDMSNIQVTVQVPSRL